MNFHFDPSEQAFLDKVHDFCLKEVAPLAPEIDRDERFPEEMLPKLAAAGLLGVPYDKKYGGTGQTYLTYIAACEEIAKYCASTSVTVSAHNSLCCWPISQYGTEEQKQKFLSPLVKGEKLGAFGMTEPAAGSDAAGQQTIAEDMGNHWLINGSKVFITNGFYADTYVITAMTDKSQGNHGISTFIVEKGTPGFTFGAKEKKMGIRGSATYELIFQDCKIPKENLLGELGKGFKVAMTILDGGRIGIAAQALGIAQGAINNCVEYITTHSVDGRRISQGQGIQFKLADLQARLDGARLLVYRAAQAKQDGEPYSYMASMGKLTAAETAVDAATACAEFVGDVGYMADYPFERFMRDSKITELYEGTSEVQRMVISSWMGVK